VRCWGYNNYGQLGRGNTITIGDDESVAGLTALTGFPQGLPLDADMTEVVTGAQHVCVLYSTGHVKCWGSGNSGLLGYGSQLTIGDNETWAAGKLVELGAVAVDLDAGGNHTCARLDTDELMCWGQGSYGQLGYGNTQHIGDNEFPSNFGPLSLDSDVVDFSAGGVHTCAALANGTLRCWGRNNVGQLGTGNTNDIGDDEGVTDIQAISLW
jgi:alpha-tubulin suppressor-like RCC1 family protein